MTLLGALSMRLSDLLAAVKDVRIISMPTSARVEVGNIRYDSRQVSPGDLFVAIRGAQKDGHGYIEDAIRRGAVAVACEPPAPKSSCAIPVIVVADALKAPGQFAAAIHDHPSNKLRMIGITGTDGKTTTTTMIAAIMEAAAL